MPNFFLFVYIICQQSYSPYSQHERHDNSGHHSLWLCRQNDLDLLHLDMHNLYFEFHVHKWCSTNHKKKPRKRNKNKNKTAFNWMKIIQFMYRLSPYNTLLFTSMNSTPLCEMANETSIRFCLLND